MGDSNYSTEIDKVDSQRLKTVVLTDGKVVKRDKLLKVHPDNLSSVDITKKITQENKAKRYLQHEAIDTGNVMQGRTRKK